MIIRNEELSYKKEEVVNICGFFLEWIFKNLSINYSNVLLGPG